LWRGNAVAVKQLVEDFARYLYLPRVAGPEVLVSAMRDGVNLLTWEADAFGYAESFDSAAERYRGLRAGQMVSIGTDDAGLLVKPETARVQLDAEVSPQSGPSSAPTPGLPNSGSSPPLGPLAPVPPLMPAPRVLRRFHGAVTLDATRVGRDAGRIAEEVLAHLTSQPGAEMSVTLEIEVRLPGGANEQVVRVVTENAKHLKFKSQGFEED